MLAWRAEFVLCGLAACAPEPVTLPPLGEALVMVDTDAPVPRLVSRLRVDIYDEAFTWLDSREWPMRRREDWPASFSLFIDEGSPDKRAWVRLRAFRDGKLRDYRGERYEKRPDGSNPALLIEPPQGDGQPRLVRDGVDVTPAAEPLPALTIDRLLRVRLHDGERGAVRVVLRMGCIGTMAQLNDGASCVEIENIREAVGDAVSVPDMDLPEPVPLSPLAAETPCALPLRPASSLPSGEALYDEEVCVPGGPFVLGSGAVVINAVMQEEPEPLPGYNISPFFNSTPERVAVVPPLIFDRYEVTVRRWRKALLDGFVTPDSSPFPNEAPLPTSSAGLTDALQTCTWSAQPREREDHPLTCVSSRAARAFCQFYGSDLPTEAGWEYAATAAGHRDEVAYPWGPEPPSCDRAVYGRVDNPALGSDECRDLGFGPQRVDATPGDVTPTGIVGLGGNVSEFLLDSYRSFASACWLSQNLVDPQCWEEGTLYRAARSAAWSDNGGQLAAAIRQGIPINYLNPVAGFRCARKGTP